MTCHPAPYNYHVTNPTECTLCGTSYCFSCSWGCPKCGFGKGMDRREFKRVKSDLEVEIEERPRG